MRLQQLYALPHMENEPGPSAMTEKSPKPRRQTGRWMPEEVEALIEGELCSFTRAGNVAHLINPVHPLPFPRQFRLDPVVVQDDACASS